MQQAVQAHRSILTATKAGELVAVVTFSHSLKRAPGPTMATTSSWRNRRSVRRIGYLCWHTQNMAGRPRSQRLVG